MTHRRKKPAPTPAAPPAAPSARNERLLTAAMALAIATAGTIAYFNSFRGKFLFDDFINIVDNPRIEAALDSPANLLSMVRADARPVAQFSLAVNYAAGGDDPWGYHLVNLLTHLASGLLLAGVVRRTLRSPRLADRFGSVATPLAGAIAVLWVVHPLQTQAVTYVVQRMESLMAMFYLLTLYGAIRALHSSRPRGWTAAAVAACALGMGCKQSMVTAPLMVLAWDVSVSREALRPLLRRRWPLYAGLAGTWVILAALIIQGPTAASAGFGMKAVGPVTYALTQFGVILHYLKLAFIPVGQNLDYGWPWADSIGDVIPGGIVVCLLLVASAMALRRRWAWGAVGAWLLLTLAPSSSIMPIADACVEHRMYLPLAAVIAAVVMGVYLAGRKLTPVLVACLVVAAALTFATIQRNAMYADVVGMWKDVADKSPEHWRGHTNLGKALGDAKRHGEAESAYRKAVALAPRAARTHFGLGVELGKLSHEAEAEAAYRQAIRLSPRHTRARNNLGDILRRQGKLAEAEKTYRDLVAMAPQYGNAHGGLGAVLAALKRYDESEEALRTALALGFSHEPGRAEQARGELVSNLLAAGKGDEALAYSRQWVADSPESAAASVSLGRSLQATGASDRVLIARYERAMALDPTNAIALNQLAWILSVSPDDALRDGPRAMKLARRVCRIAGGPWWALDTLAAAQAEAGQYDQAQVTERKAIDALTTAVAAGVVKDPSGQLLKEHRERLDLYRSGKPYRSSRR